MTKVLSVKQLRPGLPKVIDQIDRRMDRYVITKHGKPSVVMLGVDDYDALIETLDILTDKAAMVRLRQGEREIAAGKTQSWSDFEKSYAKVRR